MSNRPRVDCASPKLGLVKVQSAQSGALNYFCHIFVFGTAGAMIGRTHVSNHRRKPTHMTNTGYRALLAQREALEKQIEELRNAERGDAIEWIREQMALYEVKPEDLEPRGSRGPRKQSAPVAAKYRDPASGATWSGRGKPPRWIAGQDRDKFAITD
jgi:DNA-binding protein H-NS